MRIFTKTNLKNYFNLSLSAALLVLVKYKPIRFWFSFLQYKISELPWKMYLYEELRMNIRMRILEYKSL